MALSVLRGRFEPQDEGGCTAYVPDLPACVSEGVASSTASARFLNHRRMVSIVAYL
jgi:hypothetical protein